MYKTREDLKSNQAWLPRASGSPEAGPHAPLMDARACCMAAVFRMNRELRKLDVGIPAVVLAVSILTAMGPLQGSYVPGRLIVVLHSGTCACSPDVRIPPRAVAPPITNDARLNAALLAIGATRMTQLFGRLQNRSAMPGRLDLKNAYRVTIIGRSTSSAIALLKEVPSVVYVSPDWYVSPMH